ncbi:MULTISPECIES: hypothetical protein [unclassified Crossiella]|uniref:hypothetical protein n=1 Tax=unclassified Crossiella TaxID=2620835 RepID=UPI001FFF7B3A|nr:MULTISPECIES: hypothetical protein [unclassified Crossiella]MCK2237743.1 hypothetical protein [Crossiella sp. S99.2]MCK2255029.1 hypothetical protein [Crossiella sp. S99.1]
MIELELEDDGTRFREPDKKIPGIAEKTSAAAVTAYGSSGATPPVRQVRSSFGLFHRVFAGDGSALVASEEDVEES